MHTHQNKHTRHIQSCPPHLIMFFILHPLSHYFIRNNNDEIKLCNVTKESKFEEKNSACYINSPKKCQVSKATDYVHHSDEQVNITQQEKKQPS